MGRAVTPGGLVGRAWFYTGVWEAVSRPL